MLRSNSISNTMKKLIFSLIILILWPISGFTQTAVSDQTREFISGILSEGSAAYNQHGNIDSLFTFYAEKQLGIPYVGGLLEVPETETLVITIDGSDCVIFVEMTTALVLTTLSDRYDFDSFATNLELLRYRGGYLNGYFSRLHYFGEWLQNNEEAGMLDVLFQDESYPEVGPYHFMSSNRSSYRQLAASDSLFQLMSQKEQLLNEKRLRFIPTETIPEIASSLLTGDIVAFVTEIDGLDVTHTGIVHVNEERVSFWHASTTGSVIAEPQTLHEYVKNRSQLRGILVARISTP